jgi:eukaryotic-like serine/threonine-protein kinase
MTRPPGPVSGGLQAGGSTPGSQLATPTASSFVGRYQVLDRIAEGGMGSLYLARDPAIDRLVAIKILRRGFDTEAMRERFTREARAAGRLRHPNIVTIFDVGEHDGDPFIAMEFLAGETLAELIRQGARLSLSRRLRLLEELCDGLAYAHRAGLVHRDIKPANLMVDAGGVLKILDFGIVRVSDSGVTQAGVLVGTINYMSPEQVLGAGVDHRSDIFAVGLAAYELLSGRQAFPGTLKDGLLRRLPNVEIAPLGEIVPGLDAEVIAIVERALRKDPAERYQDLSRMRNDCARARMRIEAAEDRAAAEAVATAGETALIAHDASSPGVVVQVPEALPPSLLAEAEQAIADGNYRVALTFAGRAAALDPRDRTPSAIVARAEAGLLERARLVESSGVSRPPSSGSAAMAGTPAPSPQPTGQISNRATTAAIGVALLALIVAGVAVWPRVMPGERDASRAPGEGPGAVASGASGAAGSVSPAEAFEPDAEPVAGSEPAVPPVARPSEPRQDRPAPGKPLPPAPPRPQPQSMQEPPAEPPPATPAPATPVRVGAGVRQPRRTHHVDPRYPAAAYAARAEGTVKVEITIGRDGRVADARVVQSVPALDEAALAAVRQWQFEPTILAGQPVAVIDTVDVPFALPPAAKPQTELPVASPPGPVPPAQPSRPPVTEPATPSPSARDLRAEADRAIRDTLRRYEAAWEALDFEAVQQVHALSASEARAVRDTIRGASSYAMDIVVHAVEIDGPLRTASAECTITRTYNARIGSIPPQTTRNTLALEKRGDAWMIVSIR